MGWGWVGPQSRKNHFWRFHCQRRISDVPSFFCYLGNRISVFLFVYSVFVFTWQPLPKPVNAFPTLLGHIRVYVTVLHVNTWEFLSGTSWKGSHWGRAKSFDFSSFLCVKMQIHEVDLKQLSWPVVCKLCGENLNKDTEYWVLKGWKPYTKWGGNQLFHNETIAIFSLVCFGFLKQSFPVCPV